jgi:ABC-2 type transport system permease protein
MISGDVTNLAVDMTAIIIFDIVVFTVASLSFRKIIE